MLADRAGESNRTHGVLPAAGAPAALLVASQDSLHLHIYSRSQGHESPIRFGRVAAGAPKVAPSAASDWGKGNSP